MKGEMPLTRNMRASKSETVAADTRVAFGGLPEHCREVPRWANHQRVRALSSDATRMLCVPISDIMSS
jgi:hypothetical protein